jgi:hypothetical protein
VTSKENIDKVRFIRPTGLATTLPVGGIKLICNYYRNMRNELKANNFTKRVSGWCRKQKTALADYLDLTRLLFAVLGGRNGKQRAIKDYETMCTDDFSQLGELAFWVCENGNHKATRTLNYGHLEMLSIQKASRPSDFDFANWVDVGRHAKPRNGTRLMMYPVASVTGGVFTKGSLRHGCPTELGKVHVPAKFCSILVGHTPNRRPLECSLLL